MSLSICDIVCIYIYMGVFRGGGAFSLILAPS